MEGIDRVAPGAATENRVWKREACTPQGDIEKDPWGTAVEKF